MLVGCNTSTSCNVCEGGVCYAEVCCDEPGPEPPEPTASLMATIEIEEKESYAEGDTLNVVYTIINNGELDVVNIAVTASKMSPDIEDFDGTIDELPTGSSFDVEDTYTITAADIASGEVTFDLSAVGTATSGSVSASAEETIRLTDEPIPEGAFTLDIDGTIEGEAEIGSRMEVSYTVRNSGEADITSITVTAPKTSNMWSIETLAVGESREFVSLYTLTSEDVTAGSVEYTLTASGTTASKTITETLTMDIPLEEEEDPEATE